MYVGLTFSFWILTETLPVRCNSLLMTLYKLCHKQFGHKADSSQRFHDNWSTDISSTTLRLQTFRLRHFVYRIFVYRHLIYYCIPAYRTVKNPTSVSANHYFHQFQLKLTL